MKLPKLPKLPIISNKLLAVLPVPFLGLILLANNPGLRLAGLGGLAVPVAIAHRRLSGHTTRKLLELAESAWQRDLALTRAAGVAEGRAAERETAKTAAAEYAQQSIARAQSEMLDGFRRMESELAAAVQARDEAIALRDRALATARHHKSRHDSIQTQLATERQELDRYAAQLDATAEKLRIEQERSSVDEARADLAHQQAIASLQSQIAAWQRKYEASSDLVTGLESALVESRQAIARAESTAQQAIDRALSQQQLAHDAQIAKLKAELAQYTAGRDAIARRRAAESQLQTIEGLLDRFGPKPVFVAGPEGSGKGTTITAYLRALAAKFGAVCPVVFDPSEDRLWELTGIPSTPNRELFFSLIEQTLAKAKSTRADRTQAEKFSQQPPIVFVIDESASLYAGLNQETMNRYQTLLDQLRTRGNKYGLIPIFTGISEQIQNLKSNGKQILNGGNIAPMLRIWLNGVLEEYAAKFPSQIGDDLAEWLAVSPDEYRAAIVTVDGGAKVLSPIKHPSHHAQILGEKEPTIPVVGPKICPPPDYWPLAAKILFSQSPQADNDTLEPARELATASYQQPVSLSPLAQAIFNFAVDANEPITANKFKRFGSRFFKGASRLDATEIDRAIDELMAAEMVSAENRGNGGRTIAVHTVA